MAATYDATCRRAMFMIRYPNLSSAPTVCEQDLLLFVNTGDRDPPLKQRTRKQKMVCETLLCNAENPTMFRQTLKSQEPCQPEYSENIAGALCKVQAPIYTATDVGNLQDGQTLRRRRARYEIPQDARKRDKARGFLTTPGLWNNVAQNKPSVFVAQRKRHEY